MHPDQDDGSTARRAPDSDSGLRVDAGTRLETVRSLFPGVQTQVYLDSAAIGLLSTRSRAAMARLAESHAVQGGAAKGLWLEMVDRARTGLAHLVGGSASNIAFTQNTSTGLALVANGIDWQPGDNVVLPAGEFPSNSYLWRQLRARGVLVREVAMVAGHADLDQLAAAVDGRTRVMAISAVQYSSGYRYDLHALGRLCRNRGALSVVDGTQAVGALAVDVTASPVDVLAVGGHKWMLGPLGCGFVHLSDRAMGELRPSVVGWRSVEDPLAFDAEPDLAADARRFESGTENMVGIAGLEAAVGLVSELGAEAVQSAVLGRAAQVAEALTSAGLRVHRDQHPERRSGIVLATTGADDAACHARLLEEGVRCSLRGGLRFAPHVFTDTGDVDAMVDALARTRSGWRVR